MPTQRFPRLRGQALGNQFQQLVRVQYSQFFDRPAVRDAIDPAKRRVLSRFGAFVRQRARSSIRPASQKTVGELSRAERIRYERAKRIAKAEGRRAPKRPRASSRPGEPPRSITGLLRRSILFGFDRARESVVIGPSGRVGGTRQSPRAPEALEFGGTVSRGGRTFEYEARPFMAPAFEAELDRVGGIWKSAVR